MEFLFNSGVFFPQAYENNEERNRNRRHATEELQAPVIDKVCD